MPTILDNILIPEIIIPIINQTADLIENGREATLKSVKICNVPNDSTLIRGDNTHLKIYFHNIRNGIDMRCDYVLIANNSILFIELKSKTDPLPLAPDCIKKFKATKCVIEYFDNVLLEFNNHFFFNEKEKKYILLHLSPSINKTATSLKPKETVPEIVNNIPENFKSFAVTNGSILKFQQII